MTYLALYRKWRPQTFEEIVGQESIVATLKNAIQNNRLCHAYLFAGSRGTGKTTIARILAKALNCESGPTISPCDKCEQCQKIRNGVAVEVIEIDAASNRGIDEIRDLREKVRYAPFEGRFKVYIIDEVHMLTPEAFNALLKTLEEPPAHTIFVLATTEAVRVPPTIISRCQRFDFKRISGEKIIHQLKFVCLQEGFEIEDEALILISRTIEGSLRDALSLLDQLISFCNKKITLKDVVLLLGAAEPEILFDFSKYLREGDLTKILELTNRMIDDGQSIPQLVKDLISHFRYLMLSKIGSQKIIELSDENLKKLSEQSQLFSLDAIKNILKGLSRAETDMKWHPNNRLVLEVALMEIIENFKVLPQTREAEMNEDPDAQPDFFLQIKEKWAEIVNQVKSLSIFGYVSLQEAEPLKFENNTLIIKFKKGFSFYRERLEEAANKSALENTLEVILGKKIKVATVLDSTRSLPRELHPLPENRVSADEILEVFEGKLIS